MKLLIVGGAGYIGSHMVKFCQENNIDPVVLDNFSTGHLESIKECEVIKADLLDIEKISKVFKGYSFDGVIHFAAKSIVSESIINPMEYYNNNLIGTFNLIDQMLKNNINNIVFSSSAAIFGNPLTIKVDESHAKNPINPYGASKLAIEKFLEDICVYKKLNATCLRYFNAAGAHISGEIGESHEPETHLIPNILMSVIEKHKKLKVFGSDYPTKDGTCIRDYIHVMDLASAHYLSLINMKKVKGFSAFNLGSQNGFSVLDVIKSSSKITNCNIQYEFAKRREGDPSSLVSSSKKAKKILNWDPKYKDIDEIIKTAWYWHTSRLY